MEFKDKISTTNKQICEHAYINYLFAKRQIVLLYFPKTLPIRQDHMTGSGQRNVARYNVGYFWAEFPKAVL